jgi:hypothetical protein
MRISIRPNDSGHSLHRHLRTSGKKAIVSLNGEHQSSCITADDEAGMLVRWKVDASGNVEFDRERECVVDEVCHGRVEIEIVDEMVI